MNGLLSWWDGVELWLSGLGFVLQTIIVMPWSWRSPTVIAVVLDVVAGQRHPACCAAMRGTTSGVTMSGMPRSRVTLALVALLILVVVVWLLNR